MKTKLVTVKIISRVALGFVWFYEGLVPKILFLRADELDLVKRSGSFAAPRNGRYKFWASRKLR